MRKLRSSVACRGRWALDTDYLTSGPLTPPLLLGEQRVKEGAAWRGGKAICPVCGVKGMLAAITSNPWNVSSLNNRSFFLLLSHIKSKWQWGRDRTRDESVVIEVPGRVQALPSLTSARKRKRKSTETLIRRDRPRSATYHMALPSPPWHKYRCIVPARWRGKGGEGDLKIQPLAGQPLTSSNSIYRRTQSLEDIQLSHTPHGRREKERDQMMRAICAKKQGELYPDNSGGLC